MLGLAAFHLWDIAGCLDRCYPDVQAISNQSLLSDLRLNSWILAWVQRTLIDAPLSLWNANAFHPADGALSGSEHMLGVSALLLPLRPFGASAVLLHQVAVVLSFLITGWTTFALARWLTGSNWAAFVAATLAMFMPWRLGALGVVQQLSSQWIPLIWLLIGRIMTERPGKRVAPLLALVLLLQLTSSYYLAYQVSLSIAVLVLVLALRQGVRRARIPRLSGALVGAYLPFAVLSLPYLLRDRASDLFLRRHMAFETSAENVLAYLLESFSRLTVELPDQAVHIPLCVAFLAVLGAALGRSRGASSHALAHRSRSFAIALWLIGLGAMVLAMGNALSIGEHVIDLPGRFASEWVPGYRYLRAPARWLQLLGIATPLLAGIGVCRAEWALSRISGRSSRATLAVFRLALLVLIPINMPWGTIPVRPADLVGGAQPYQVLRELPPGPVLEIPWSRTDLERIELESRYMLASTHHWRPMLNGFTAYPPHTYSFLYHLGWQLPAEDALTKLTRSTDLRWIVVHVDKLSGPERRRWRELIERGVVKEAYRDADTRILEVVDREEAGAWLDAIRSPKRRPRTLTGLTREPIVIPAGSGRLGVEIPETPRAGSRRLLWIEVVATLENGTSRTWPGFDVQAEGLVELRYRFVDSDGKTAGEGVVPLSADVPAGGKVVTRGYFPPPAETGEYRLCFALVQRLGDELVRLGVPEVERQITVEDE